MFASVSTISWSLRPGSTHACVIKEMFFMRNKSSMLDVIPCFMLGLCLPTLTCVRVGSCTVCVSECVLIMPIECSCKFSYQCVVVYCLHGWGCPVSPVLSNQCQEEWSHQPTICFWRGQFWIEIRRGSADTLNSNLRDDKKEPMKRVLKPRSCNIIQII